MVGGSVRDSLLGLEPNDIDFATNATPEQMIQLAKGKIDTWETANGKAHGTIVFQEDSKDYEITTFRKDVSTDGRNATVEFAKTIQEDLARRDFTINAMAFNMLSGMKELIDPFNGMKDIENRVLRFVGDAFTRIQEDKLRVLRAYRFLSQLGKGWKFIDNEVILTRILSADLNIVSKERIRDELIKMFKHNPCFSLYHMPKWLQCYIFESLDFYKGTFHGHFHAEDIKQHLMVTLSTSCRLTNKPLLRLACFLHDIGKCMDVEYNEWGYPTFPRHDTLGAERVEQWMKTMKFSNDEIHYVTQLIKHHMVNQQLFDHNKPQQRSVKRYVMSLGEELLDDMILLNYCDRSGNLANTKLCSYEEYLQKHTIKPIWLEIKAKETAFKVTDLKVNGHDIMALGYNGKEVGLILNGLFKMVEEGVLQNTREELMLKLSKAVFINKILNKIDESE